MIIQTSWLRNFRNYEKTEVTWNPEMNVITGKNAQGKTNLLESIVYLSLSRSYRTMNDSLLIRNGAEHAEIGCVVKDESTRRLQAVIHSRGKTLMVNSNPVKKSSDFAGLLNVVIFSPDDMTIFNDAPRERRRIMNQEISKISNSYLHAMNRYQSLLKNRNALLKEQRKDLQYLDTLDEQMINESLIIIEKRQEFVQCINRFIPDLYQELSMDQIHVDLSYSCCIENPENNAREQLVQMYQDTRNRDLETSVSNKGIQRDDIRFNIDGKNLIFTASQGQKRMAMLAFKMALMNYIKINSGRLPVLLLDDVLSELDRTRQRKLIDMVSGPYQCMITAAELPDFLGNRSYSKFVIEDGSLKTDGGAG